MNLGKLQIPQVVQENLTDIIKLYVRYGPDYSLISKEFELMVQQKITIKFITQFCFELNKKTYALIIDYLKKNKDAKGQSDISYDNLWPQIIDDTELRTEIQNIPTKILRCLNKDISEAYHLLMESFSDQSLENLFRYERIRDLYHFMTEIILKKNSRPKKQRRQKKQIPKQILKKKVTFKSAKSNQNIPENLSDDMAGSQSEWSHLEERYLCALYLEKPLVKCCQKLNQKFGQKEKWRTTKKVFKKAEQIFQNSLRRAFRFSQLKSLKQTLKRLNMTKQNLIAKIIKKKSNTIEKYVMRFYKTVDQKKRIKSLEQISKEVLIMVEAPEDVKREPVDNEDQLKEQEKIKEEGYPKLTEAESIEVDSNVSFEEKEIEVKVETGDGEKSELREESGPQSYK